MTTVYVLGENNTPEDNKTIYEVIPWTLQTDYNITDEIQVITGDLIDDTTFLYDRLSNDPSAWFVILTDSHIRICEPNMRDALLKGLKENPDKAASELFKSGKKN